MTKIFLTDNTEWSSENLWKMISADEKLIKTTRDKRSGGSILQIFIRRTFKTWNTSPNNVKNSTKYPLLTLTTYFDTSFTVQFYQVFHCFLVWYPSCACAVFSSSTASTKIVYFCSQYRENFSYTVILLVFLWKSNIQLITKYSLLIKNINNISLLIFITLK